MSERAIRSPWSLVVTLAVGLGLATASCSASDGTDGAQPQDSMAIAGGPAATAHARGEAAATDMNPGAMQASIAGSGAPGTGVAAAGSGTAASRDAAGSSGANMRAQTAGGSGEVGGLAGMRAAAADGGNGGSIGAAGSLAADAGDGAASSDGGTSATDENAETHDDNGPCKALNLFCFDVFDMFIFNPQCATCNNGMGCVDCVDFQAI